MLFRFLYMKLFKLVYIQMYKYLYNLCVAAKKTDTGSLN